MALFQIHMQQKDGSRPPTFKAQVSGSDAEEIQHHIENYISTHVLPECCVWLVCGEESEHFVWAVPDECVKSESEHGNP